MDRPAQSVSEKRLAQVRALKGRYFADDLTVEEQLEAKDAQIVLLEGQVAELEKQLARAQRRLERPEPETKKRSQRVGESDASTDSRAADEPQFDFYRD